MNEPVTGDELLSLIQITSSLLHAFVFPSIPFLQSCSLGLKDFQGVAPELPPPSFPCAVSVHFFSCSYNASQGVIIPSVPAELPFYQLEQPVGLGEVWSSKVPLWKLSELCVTSLLIWMRQEMA